MSNNAKAELKSALDLSLAVLDNIPYHNTESDMAVVGLYLTLVELSHGMVAMIDAGAEAGVATLHRSALDSYVDLKNLVQDDVHRDPSGRCEQCQYFFGQGNGLIR